MTRLALLAALLTACVNAPTFNGLAPSDASSAGDAAPEMGPATVLATMRNGTGTPQADVHVVFTDPAGNVTFEGDTTGTGDVSGPAVAGGTLFAAYASPPVLVVITEIKPGVTYDVGEPRYTLAPTAPVATMVMSKNPGSLLYRAVARCGGGLTTIAGTATAVTMMFTWNEGCSSGETVGVMGIAYDAQPVPVASKYVEVTYAAPTISAVGVFSPPSSMGLTLSEASDLQLVYPTVSAIDHGVLFGGPESPSIALGGTTATLPYFVAGSTTPMQLSANLFNGQSKGALYYAQNLAANTLGVAVDLSLVRRPAYLTTLDVPADPGAPATWAASPGAASQLGLLDVAISRANEAPGIGRTVRYVFPPSDTAALARPVIPDVPAFANFQPAGGDSVSGRVYYVRALDSTDARIPYDVLSLVADRAMYISPTAGTSTALQQLVSLPDVNAAFLSSSQ